MPENTLRVALITTFPPSDGSLNYYGFYLVKGYAQQDSISRIFVLADRISTPETFSNPKVAIQRCWRLNSLLNPFLILRAVLRARPDVVHFNIHTGFQFGTNRIAHGLGLLSPVLVRLAGYRIVVTLHDFIEMVDMGRTIYGASRLNRLIAHWIIKLVFLCSHQMVFLSEGHQTIFRMAYGRGNTAVVPHWVLDSIPHDPSSTTPSFQAKKRILFFGYISRPKNLELLVDAFQVLSREDKELELVIAGGLHPAEKQEYLEAIRARLQPLERVVFLDHYISEEEQMEVFKDVSLLVMPYNATTGVSGVFHVACRYGTPILASDLPEFRGLADKGAGIQLFPVGNKEALVHALRGLLANATLRQQMSERNRKIGNASTLDAAIGRYVELLHQVAG